MSPSREPVRVGVLGTGAISQVMHLPILVERDDVEVAWVSDVDRPKAASVAERMGIERVLSPEEAAEDGVDGVVICTPNAEHEAQAIASLQSGRHVLVERPLALTAKGAKRILDAAGKAGKAVMVGMGHRYRPDVAALTSFVATGELGEIFSVRTSHLARPLPLSRAGWRSDPDAGGGALMDLGVPTLDLALWLIGYPTVERVCATIRSEEGAAEESASLHVVASGGVSVSVEVSRTYFSDQDHHYARIMGTEGSGSLPPLSIHKQLGGRPLEVTPRQPRPRGGESLYTNAYRRGLDHFVRVVAGQAEAPLPREQVSLMEVIEAAYRSARKGREVSV